MKKRILGPRTTLGIVIVGILIAIGILINQDNTDDNTKKMYQTINLFIKIDDIAHQEINENLDENPFTTQELKDKFYKIDDIYHSTRDIEEKHKTEKKMIALLKEAEESRPNVTGNKESDFEKDEEYRELIEQFKEIR
ncbi:MAG: hypothetical protein WC010_03400 [Candidatus Absconditabacterales bacterium]